MAKELIIEISWLRPLKLIGLANLLCGIIVFIISMILEDWVVSDENENFQFYMCLWKKCKKIQPLAATRETAVEADWECLEATSLGLYMSIVQALIVIPFVASVVAFVIGIVAYCKREWRFLYKIAAVILIIAAIAVLVAVILFPVMFINDLPFSAFFWFGWGYGVAWAAFCFILCAAVLFLISQDKKEIYHTQKTVSL
uniref:Transmembrane protein 47 n=1 Tax=Ciona savignyi TaxID=51511 RepID=H2Z8C1_CIOSA